MSNDPDIVMNAVEDNEATLSSNVASASQQSNTHVGPSTQPGSPTYPGSATGPVGVPFTYPTHEYPYLPSAFPDGIQNPYAYQQQPFLPPQPGFLADHSGLGYPQMQYAPGFSFAAPPIIPAPSDFHPLVPSPSIYYGSSTPPFPRIDLKRQRRQSEEFLYEQELHIKKQRRQAEYLSEAEERELNDLRHQNIELQSKIVLCEQEVIKLKEREKNWQQEIHKLRKLSADTSQELELLKNAKRARLDDYLAAAAQRERRSAEREKKKYQVSGPNSSLQTDEISLSSTAPVSSLSDVHQKSGREPKKGHKMSLESRSLRKAKEAALDENSDEANESSTDDSDDDLFASSHSRGKQSREVDEKLYHLLRHALRGVEGAKKLSSKSESRASSRKSRREDEEDEAEVIRS